MNLYRRTEPEPIINLEQSDLLISSVVVPSVWSAIGLANENLITSKPDEKGFVDRAIIMPVINARGDKNKFFIAYLGKLPRLSRLENGSMHKVYPFLSSCHLYHLDPPRVDHTIFDNW